MKYDLKLAYYVPKYQLGMDSRYLNLQGFKVRLKVKVLVTAII